MQNESGAGKRKYEKKCFEIYLFVNLSFCLFVCLSGLFIFLLSKMTALLLAVSF